MYSACRALSLSRVELDTYFFEWPQKLAQRGSCRMCRERQHISATYQFQNPMTHIFKEKKTSNEL
uniref:Uncharacterized protein n=1 Tax=Anguilla anguilla TaxID=7936 RepID=A0A0E9X954_ANGAN